MKYFVIFFFLIGFVGSAFALDVGNSHPTEISLEEYYKIEILGLKDEYMVGEEYSFYFVVSGNGYSCANYQVIYPDENGNIMHMGAEVLCASEQSMHEFNFNPLGGKRTLGNTGIDKPGTYTVTVTFEKPSKYYPTTISKEFRVVGSFAENFNKLSPLKQFKDGVSFKDIKCRDSLQLTQKYDGSPACVKPDTVFELINRGWVSEIIKAVQSRDLSSEMNQKTSSYMNRVIPTIDDFKKILSEPYDIDSIFFKFGEPHDDIGSGIHIYVYELNDFTKIWIGYVDDIWYVQHVDANGNLIEELFVKNTENPE